MQLPDLVAAVTGRGLVDPADLVVVDAASSGPELPIERATHDSRAAGPGTMYCCIPGALHDGHDFAAAAVAAGSPALLVERVLDLAVAQLVVPSVRRAIGPVCAVLEGVPSDRVAIVGITGTNGKTTITVLLSSIARAAGMRCGTIGTLTGARTTPEAPVLQAELASMRDDGCELVVMEVSSHALAQHRVDGTRFRAAAFTNLSQDHLDFHTTMEEYFEAKALLFEPDRTDLAVIDVDDDHGRRLAASVEVPVVACSLADAEELELRADGSRFRWRGQVIELALPGRFNVANALVAASLADALGIEPQAIARGLADAGPIAGRFERVDVGQPFLAAVDFAHTPDGLRQLLDAAREVTAGRVVLVFGAGGDRDRTKRPLMGAAAELADVVVLTSDNPRHEDPAEIIAGVRSGMAGGGHLVVEPDRRAAIAAAVALAEPGDCLLVAGKGHETTQTVGERTFPFDDRQELRAALSALVGGQNPPESSP
ncbi:MAG: UDP-N-acetylmuramoyl-L-alanyl-D-glutamate--2,6-diaminopimelate ligase [Acidimicrobiales bacterium]